MSVSDRYLSTLSGWVKEQVKEKGSLDKLAQQMAFVSGANISGETLRKWSDKDIGKEGLRGRTLGILAKYRSETVEQTVAWLEGREVGNSPEKEFSSAIAAVKFAPIAELPACLEVIAQRMNLALVSSATTSVSMSPLSELIRRELLRQGFNPDDRNSVQYFMSAIADLWKESERVEQLWRIVQGEGVDAEDPIVPAIVATLSQFSGRPNEFEIVAIQERIKNAHDRNGNGHTNGRVKH